MSKSPEWWQIPPQKFIFLQNKKKHKLQRAGPAAQGVGLARVTRSPGPPAVGHPPVLFGDSHPHFPLDTGTFPPRVAEYFKARGHGWGSHPDDRSPLPSPALRTPPAPFHPYFWENIFLFCKAGTGVENGRALGNPGGLYCLESHSHLT